MLMKNKKIKNKYKRLLYLLIGFICIILTVVGCKKDDTIVQRDNVFDDSQEENNTMEMQQEKDGLKSVEVSVKDEKNYYEYNGTDVVIEYQYMADGADSVGIMILCDGIATPFYTKENNENEILHCIELKNGEQKNIDLCFVPYGKAGENVSVEIVDIIEPDYDVSNGDKEDIISAYISGQKYKVQYISGIYIGMKADGISYDKDFCTEYSQKLIHDEDISMYDDAVLQRLNAEGYVNDERSLWYTVTQGEQLNIDISYFGSAYGSILTSIYIDGKLYPAFEGSEYAECPVDDKHYTQICGIINTSGLEKGRHTVFCVCGNADYNMATPVQSFVIEVK